MKTKNHLSTKLTFLFVLFFLLVASQHVSAQGSHKKRYVYNPNPTYFGYELGLGTQLSTLKSDIPQLDNLHVNNLGILLGLKITNSKVAFRPYAGWYYSGSMPYTIDVLTAGMSGNIYFLRLNSMRKHAVEPYALFSAAYQSVQFYGSYIKSDQSTRNIYQEPRLGELTWCTGSAGLGAEFRLETNDRQFAHLFVETKYSIPFSYQSSNRNFTHTSTTAPITITVGVSLGKF